MNFCHSELQTSMTRWDHEQLILPLPLLNLGNCSHYAITSMDYDISSAGSSCLVAAAGSSILTWDILKGQRTSTYSCIGQYYACVHLTSNLIGAAGSDRNINLYDTRSKCGARPTWSTQVLSDNLYTIAKIGGYENNSCCSKIYLAGAAGLIHSLDLRAGKLEVWDLPRSGCSDRALRGESPDARTRKPETNESFQTNAILDISCQSNLLVAVRENGEMVGVSIEETQNERQHQNPNDRKYCCEDKGSVLFSQFVMGAAESRTNCDTRLNDADNIDIVTGTEHGSILILTYDENKRQNHSFRQITIGSDPVLAVKWAKHGVYFGAGDNLGLVMHR